MTIDLGICNYYGCIELNVSDDEVFTIGLEDYNGYKQREISLELFLAILKELRPTEYFEYLARGRD